MAAVGLTDGSRTPVNSRTIFLINLVAFSIKLVYTGINGGGQGGFEVKRTLCRIYDPIREEIYRNLGLETISPTLVGARLLKETLEREPAPQESEG